MIVSNMHSFFYKNRSGTLGHHVAVIHVSLDLSDKVLRSAVSVVDWIQDQSPCLVQTRRMDLNLLELVTSTVFGRWSLQDAVTYLAQHPRPRLAWSCG